MYIFYVSTYLYLQQARFARRTGVRFAHSRSVVSIAGSISRAQALNTRLLALRGLRPLSYRTPAGTSRSCSGRAARSLRSARLMLAGASRSAVPRRRSRGESENQCRQRHKVLDGRGCREGVPSASAAREGHSLGVGCPSGRLRAAPAASHLFRASNSGPARGAACGALRATSAVSLDQTRQLRHRAPVQRLDDLEQPVRLRVVKDMVRPLGPASVKELS